MRRDKLDFKLFVSDCGRNVDFKLRGYEVLLNWVKRQRRMNAANAGQRAFSYLIVQLLVINDSGDRTAEMPLKKMPHLLLNVAACHARSSAGSMEASFVLSGGVRLGCMMVPALVNEIL
jgi:hypothetical protein